MKTTTAAKCHICEKSSPRCDRAVYLAHGNGGAYGVAPAHKKCVEATFEETGHGKSWNEELGWYVRGDQPELKTEGVEEDSGVRPKKGEAMKVFTTTTVRQEVVLNDDAVEEVFNNVLDSYCGGTHVYLNDKSGEVEEWEDTGHGSGITDVVDKKPSALKLAALKLRSLLKQAEREEAAERESRRGRRTA
jgi:hypothetical protein